MKKVKIKPDEFTKQIKENDSSLEDDPFIINKSTMDTLIHLGSQTEIVNEKNRDELETPESGSIIQTEISSPDGELDCQKRLKINTGEMIQSVNLTENIDVKSYPYKEHGGLQKDMFTNENDDEENVKKDIKNEKKSTKDIITHVESQKEIVKDKVGNEKEILESGGIIQTEISSPYGGFDSKMRTDNINAIFQLNKENELQKERDQ